MFSLKNKVGITVFDVTDAQREEMRTVVMPLWEEYSQKSKAEDLSKQLIDTKR